MAYESRTPEERERERLERERLEAQQYANTRNPNLGRRRSGAATWWWVWLVALVILAIWFVGWGWWGGRRTAATRVAPAVPAATAPVNSNNGATTNGAVATSVAQLTANPQNFAGQQVVVPQAQVEQVNGNNLTVGSGNGRTMLVKTPAGTQQPAQGSTVKVTGVVSNSESSNGKNSAGQDNNGYYIQASAVTPVSAGQNGSPSNQ